MGWAIGYDGYWKRDIGYGVPAICDHPDCNNPIDRGLAYVCGGEPYGGDGCGLYFCHEHLPYRTEGMTQCCEQCFNAQDPFEPKPDTKEWVNWKLTDPSWSQWKSNQSLSDLDKLYAIAQGA